MNRLFLTALAFACVVISAVPASAKSRTVGCVETGTVMAPSCMGQAVAPVRVAKVRTARTVRPVKTARVAHRSRLAAVEKPEPVSFGIPTPSVAYSIAKPVRYIGGRLICAINVSAALAERGIRGTGSALAHSYDRWGVRVAQPVPGAVAVTDRRGGGHVAIVSRVEGSRVWAWNPSTRGRGWREVEYTHRAARYRVAG